MTPPLFEKPLRTAALGLLLLTSFACSQGSGPDPGTALGEAGQDSEVKEALADEDTMHAAMGIVRGVLYGETAPTQSSELGSLPGRRAFVCAYQERPTRICATGTGSDLAGSIRAAAEALKTSAGSKLSADNKADIRLKLDVVTRTSDGTFKRTRENPKKRKVALSGYWVRTGTGVEGGDPIEVSWILPSELLETGLYSNQRGNKGIPRKSALRALRSRNDSLGELPEEFPYQRFWTISWVEKDQPGQTPPGVFRLYRLHPYEFDEVTPDRLLQRVVWAADYLISSVSSKGKIRYRYKVARDRDSSSYNLLRHGGTTYSILQAYDRTRFEPYLAASKQALQYLFEHCDRDERVGPWLPKDHPSYGDSMFVVSPPDRRAPEGKVKLGGAGLALVAIDQYVESTGDTTTYLDEARAFGRFLAASQKEDGEFIYFPPRHPGGPLTDTDDSAYYPGEAILGLIRLHSWDPNPLWLETAVRGADWLIDVRDEGKDSRRLANDHWLMLALSYLYKYTEDRRYLDHSLALCRAVEYQYLKNEPAWAEYPDFQGGYYDPPRSTPAATRGEGLGAVLDTCLLAGEDCDWVEELLHETVRHEMLSQYDPDMSFWMQDRAKSFGGWNGGLLDMDIRNDFVQHNMSSLIGAERHLRYAMEQTVPGGPGWTEQILGGRAFAGLPAEQLTSLRADTLRYRGETRWEKLVAETEATPEAESGEASETDGSP